MSLNASYLVAAIGQNKAALIQCFARDEKSACNAVAALFIDTYGEEPKTHCIDLGAPTGIFLEGKPDYIASILNSAPAQAQSSQPELKLTEGPKESFPSNFGGGLYMNVLRDSNAPLSDFFPRIKEIARAHGYNPNGRSTTGAPCSHGLGTVTNAVWFHDKA